MLETLIRALGALTLAAAGLLVAAPAAQADVERDAELAELVFRGTVVEDRDNAARPTYAVEADVLWKGSLSRARVNVTEADAPSRCRLELRVDQTYVFFVTEQGSALATTTCDGTSRATSRITDKLDEVLGEGQPLASEPTEREPAEFTLVEGAEPETFSRLAAPGGALVLLGLLGLLVVGRASRR